MNPQKSTKLSDDTIKLIAGVLLGIGSLFGVVFTFLNIVDLSLTRKVLIGLIALLAWVLLEFFAWRLGKGKEKRKTSWSLLLDMIVSVFNEVNPDEKRFYQKELFIRISRWALIGFIAVIIVAAIYKALEDWASPIIEPPTATPTPTQTLTSTPSSTVTLIPTLPPESDFIYYMVVYDSSLKMNETFHGEEKWQVAKNLLIDIMNGLNPNAHYSMVVVGNPENAAASTDECDDPSALAVPFSQRNNSYDFLVNLQPQGGGSFYKAFVTAKNQLQELPRDSIRTLIYITGASDSCDREDEWEQLRTLFDVGDASFKTFSQIIILDDDGIRAQTLVEKFKSLSNDNIQAAAPQSLSEIRGGGVTLTQIINHVNVYVNVALASLPTNVPTITLTPSITPTLRPGETYVPPPTNTPSFTPTLTATLTASLVPSLTPFVCPAQSHPYLGGSGLGGSVSIDTLGDCSFGYAPESAIYTSGSFSDLPADSVIWELVYAPDGLYYPQSPNACGDHRPPDINGNTWQVDTYLGAANDPPRQWYEIVAVVADPAASASLSQWFIDHCPSFPGIDPGSLQQLNITEKSWVRVQTR